MKRPVKRSQSIFRDLTTRYSFFLKMAYPTRMANTRPSNVEDVLAPLRIAIVSEDDFINDYYRTMERFIENVVVAPITKESFFTSTHDAFACYRTINLDTLSNDSRKIKQTDTTLEIIFDVQNGDIIDNFECNAPYRMFVGMNGSVEVPPLKQSVVIYNTHFKTRFVIDTTCGIPQNEIVFKYRSIALLNSKLRRGLVHGPHLNGGVLFDHLNVTLPT